MASIVSTELVASTHVRQASLPHRFEASSNASYLYEYGVLSYKVVLSSPMQVQYNYCCFPVQLPLATGTEYRVLLCKSRTRRDCAILARRQSNQQLPPKRPEESETPIMIHMPHQSGVCTTLYEYGVQVRPSKRKKDNTSRLTEEKFRLSARFATWENKSFVRKMCTISERLT
jgi:hypothetical protein